MRFKHIFILISLVFVIVACQSETQITPTEELVDVRIQMSWIHEYSIAPFHVATEEGLFEQNGINVELIEGGFSEEGYIEPIDQVLNGSVDFGLASASSILEARSNGQSIVAVANILQLSPLSLISLDPSFTQPSDLSGLRIMAADGGARQSTETLLNAQGIDFDEVQIMERTSFGVEPLLDNETDVLVAWLINEGVSVQEAGENPSFILFSDYGIEAYDFVLFTTEDMVQNDATIVQAVVDSIVEGIDFAIANPETAIDHTITYNADLDRSQQLARLEATIPLMAIANLNIGGMSPDVWSFIAGQLMENGSINEELNVGDAYTLQFVTSEE